MDHRVKVDGRMLVVSDEGLNSALRTYINGRVVKYRELKDTLLRFEIASSIPGLGETGYLDFDDMEHRKREEPVVKGQYLSYLSRLRFEEDIRDRSRSA